MSPTEWSTEKQIKAMEMLRKSLELPELKRIIKHGQMGDAYQFELDGGRVIELGNFKCVRVQSTFTDKFIPQMRRAFKPVEREKWWAIYNAIERLAEERDTTASDAEETRGWLAAYWPQYATRATVKLTDPKALYDQLTTHRGPFVSADGRRFLRLTDFAQWVNRYAGHRISTTDLSVRLAALGFTREQPSARRPDDVDASKWPEVAKLRYVASPFKFEMEA